MASARLIGDSRSTLTLGVLHLLTYADDSATASSSVSASMWSLNRACPSIDTIGPSLTTLPRSSANVCWIPTARLCMLLNTPGGRSLMADALPAC